MGGKAKDESELWIFPACNHHAVLLSIQLFGMLSFRIHSMKKRKKENLISSVFYSSISTFQKIVEEREREREEKREVEKKKERKRRRKTREPNKRREVAFFSGFLVPNIFLSSSSFSLFLSLSRFSHHSRL